MSTTDTEQSGMTAIAVNATRDDGTPYVHWMLLASDGTVLAEECGYDEGGHMTPDDLTAFEQQLISDALAEGLERRMGG